MTASDLVLHLLNTIEKKNEQITQLKLDWQKEHWQKQFIMIERDFNKLCVEMSSKKNLPDAAKALINKQLKPKV